MLNKCILNFTGQQNFISASIKIAGYALVCKIFK